MEEHNHNSPRRTRSGRLLGCSTRGGEGEHQGDDDVEMLAVVDIVTTGEETVVDVVDLTEDYIDEDDAFGDLLGDTTETTNNEDNGGARNLFPDDSFDDLLSELEDVVTGTADNEEEWK